MAGNPNWWSMHSPSLNIPPQYVLGSSSNIPFNSLTENSIADPPQSWSQLLLLVKLHSLLFFCVYVLWCLVNYLYIHVFFAVLDSQVKKRDLVLVIFNLKAQKTGMFKILILLQEFLFMM